MPAATSTSTSSAARPRPAQSDRFRRIGGRIGRGCATCSAWDWWRWAPLLSVALRGRVEPTNLVMIYLAIVVAAAVYLGRGPSLLAAMAGVLAFDYFPGAAVSYIRGHRYSVHPDIRRAAGGQPDHQRIDGAGPRAGGGGHPTRGASHGAVQSWARPYVGRRSGADLARSSSRTSARPWDAKWRSSCQRTARCVRLRAAPATSPMRMSWRSPSGHISTTSQLAAARTRCPPHRCDVCR